MTLEFQETPEERLFKASLEFPASERAQFVSKAADGDEQLLETVIMMLSGYEEEGGDQAMATMADEVGTGRKRWASTTEEPGTAIGSFTLIRKIGEGGMGSVWEAEQKIPIERKVALKLIKLGMDTEETIRRFERERQALAVLDHQNIAKVLEAGSTDLGRPYFVMELVDGIPIHKYCQNKKLTVEDRLHLMLAICSGIEHAHRRGIIHRDLKPSNILVSENGQLKVIDFGIAKATAAEGGTLFTREAQISGTPAYMSPEQASGNAAAIETRSDVYSLGVVLYELLAGAPPFDPQRLESTGLAEMQKIISEEEPPKPSTRQTGSSTDLQTTILTPDFERDLDWIVLKAMAKEPERRYSTAAELGEDLQRYLDGEVVSAVPPTATYRLGKFVRRNKLVAAATTAVFAALLIGLIASLLLMERAKEQAARADEARRDSTLTVADMQANNGAAAAKDDENALARLWFAKAAETAVDDPVRTQQNHQRMAAWQQELRPAVRAFDPGTRFAMELDWNPRYPALISLTEGEPRKVEILDVKEKAKVWRPDLDWIMLARWSPSGDSLLALSANSAHVLSYPEGEELHKIEIGEVRLAQWNPDGRRVLLEGEIWNLETGTRTAIPNNGTGLVNVEFDSSGALLLLQTSSHTHIYPSEPPFAALHPGQSSMPYTPSRFLGSGVRYATVELNGTVHVRDSQTGSIVETYEDADRAPYALDLFSSPDGRFVIREDKELIDRKRKDIVQQISQQELWISAAFDPQSRLLAIGSHQNIIELWSLESRQLVQQIGFPHGQIHSLDFSPDGRFLASGEEGLVRVWRIDIPNPSHSITVGNKSNAVVLSPSGKMFAPAGSSAGRGELRGTQVFDIASGEPLGPVLDPKGYLLSAVFAQDESWLALSVSTTASRLNELFVDKSSDGTRRPGRNGGGSGNIQFWDYREGKRLGESIAMPSEPREVVADPSGNYLAVVCANGEIVEVDVFTREATTVFKEPQPLRAPEAVKHNGALSYSPDGRLLIRWGHSPGLPIWDREARDFLLPPEPTNGPLVYDLTVREDVIVAAIQDPGQSKIRFINPQTGQALAPPLAYANWPMVARLNPSGELLLAAGQDYNARVWNWREQAPQGPSLPHSKFPLAGCFLPDHLGGVVTGGYEPAIRFWDYRTGIPLRPDIAAGETTSIELTPDQRWLIAGATGLITVIDLDIAFPKPDLPIDVALSLAQIDANAEIIDGGGIGRFTAAQWMNKWRAFREKNPDYPGHQLILQEPVIPVPFDKGSTTDIAKSVVVNQALTAKFAATTLITPIAVESSTAHEDVYPAAGIINGQGLSAVLTDATQIPMLTHGTASNRSTWLTADNLPDYFGEPGARPTPILTFTLPEPAEISAFVHWVYRFSSDNVAEANQPSKLRFTFCDAEGNAISEPFVHQLKQSFASGADIVPLPITSGVKTIQLEFLDNFHPGNGGDRLGIGEVRFLSGYPAK